MEFGTANTKPGRGKSKEWREIERAQRKQLVARGKGGGGGGGGGGGEGGCGGVRSGKKGNCEQKGGVLSSYDSIGRKRVQLSEQRNGRREKKELVKEKVSVGTKGGV